MGLTFDGYAVSCIRKETLTGAKRMRNQEVAAGRGAPPCKEDIAEALRTFPSKIWEAFLKDFSSNDLDALREYLDAHRDMLARELGQEKYLSIYGAALSRWAALLEPSATQGIEISAPVQTALLWRRYRELNAARAPRPEDAHAAIARTLTHAGDTWTARRVKLMLDRMRENEQMKAFIDRDGPEPDLEGDMHGKLLYWAKGRYALRRHQRRKDLDAR